MKKIFLIVAILMLATPAFAVTVTITARPGADVNQVEVWYEVNEPVLVDCNDGNRPRAFGLNITTGRDANIIDINVPFEGECDDVNRGYGIFPGTINIVDDEVTDWGGPIAPEGDPGASGTGLDTNTIIVEMGSLYTGANCPPDTNMLFFITVELDCNVSITGDASRTGTGSAAKGVILESLGPVTVVWPSPYVVIGVSAFVPDVVGMAQAAATTAIEAEDLVVGEVTQVCSAEPAGTVLSTDPVADTELVQGSSVDMVVALACDWGDANDLPYPTLSASNGAVHIIVAGVYLGPGPQGTSIDSEADGQPNPTATGDDIAGASANDEDGVVFTVPGMIVLGAAGPHVTVTASIAGNLNAWLDLNADGDWADPCEHIFDDRVLIAGPNPLNIPLGCGDATSGMTVSRWRFTTGVSIPDTNEYGWENNGEVEDHEVEIVCHAPDVLDMNVADATAIIEAACFTVGDICYECSDVIDACNVIYSNPPYCEYSGGGEVDLVVSTGPCPAECYAGQPDYAQWTAAGKPECWCYSRQCHGDADGKRVGNIFQGYWWVGTTDLDVMSIGWLVKDPPKGPGILHLRVNCIPATCADFKHDKKGNIFQGYWRIDTGDLDEMSLYWLIKDPPKTQIGRTPPPADCLPGNRVP